MRLSNLLSAGLAFLAACASPAAAMGADNPPVAKGVVRDAAPVSKPPMVIRNPDGTMTVQKEPSIEALNTNAPSLVPWHLQDTIPSGHEAQHKIINRILAMPRSVLRFHIHHARMFCR